VILTRSVERTIERILYLNYPHNKFPVEREAFYMQSHPQAFPEVIRALQQRCG